MPPVRSGYFSRTSRARPEPSAVQGRQPLHRAHIGPVPFPAARTQAAGRDGLVQLGPQGQSGACCHISEQRRLEQAHAGPGEFVLAVAHRQFKEMGLQAVRALGKPDHLLYDLKYIYSASETDIRL